MDLCKCLPERQIISYAVGVVQVGGIELLARLPHADSGAPARRSPGREGQGDGGYYYPRHSCVQLSPVVSPGAAWALQML